MNKKELEEMFDKYIDDSRYTLDRDEKAMIKSYIFEVIIQEVLKNFIPNNREWQYTKNLAVHNRTSHWEELEILFKQKAKELYWIDL